MAPKKNRAARNGFFFFMMDVKKSHGRSYSNMQEVTEAAGPLWNNMTAKDKEPYELMAKREKQSQKYTSLGASIAEVQEQENAIKRKEQQLKLDTQKTVQLLVQTNRPLPLGYSFQAKKTSEETHQLPIPVGQDAPNNTAEVFNDLMAFLLEIKSDLHDLPPLYAREKDLAYITETLQMFASDFSHNENMFNVHSIEYLLFILKNAVTEHAWPALSLSAEEIQRDVYDFTLDIACEYHRSIGVPIYCSQAIVTRLAYIICDNCCHHLEIDLIPGRHVPNKAKVPAFSKAHAASYTPSIADDQESVASYKSAPLAESDRCSSTLSFRSTQTAFDDSDFPALGGDRRKYTADSDSNSDWYPASRWPSKTKSNPKRPVELPSALANKMETLSVQEQQQPPTSSALDNKMEGLPSQWRQQPFKPKGRGRGIVKK